MSDKKFVLCVNEAQAKLIEQALDFYSRIGIGQLEILREHPVISDAMMNFSRNTRSDDHRLLLNDSIRNMKALLFTFGENANHGIYNPDVPDTMRQAWDIQKVIRHHRSMESVGWPAKRDHKIMFGVNFDTPKASSIEQPLPTMKTVVTREESALRIDDRWMDFYESDGTEE